MRDVFIASDNIITSLGSTTSENAGQMLAGSTGIRYHEDIRISPSPFYASLLDESILSVLFSHFGDPDQYTRFEQMAICSVRDALTRTGIDIEDPRTVFILSTTKGNIDLLENDKRKRFGDKRIYLWETARIIQKFLNFRNAPIIVSNACISGLQAVITGSRLIGAGVYDNAVINGTDIISEFVFSGFNSFKSLSTGPCRPFDETRDGLSLGEGSGTIILTSSGEYSDEGGSVIVGEGFITNDANHISGPSRTGEGLYLAIKKLLDRTTSEVGFISAHGTGTLFNDEMESIALTRAGLQAVPVNSLKGYWGHTLGAAGIIESIMSVHSLRNNELLRSFGYNKSGLTNPISVIDTVIRKDLSNCLKIASGFGGCNAALLLIK
ncbi:MAG: beta-ketoacyl synthase N-terminal-like domain-containing protein [Bacteroidales bacterium]|jgi:3-oxoacyl-[acyl-carrier-protein] synthase-1